MDYSLIGIIGLIFLSGCFSASEIALTSLSRAKVYAIENDGKFASRAIVKLKQKSQRLLIAILVGNQVVNILASTLATVWGIKIFGENHISFVIFIFTIALIAFGSIAPKAFALGFAEIFARIMAYPLLLFVYVVQPVIWFFEKFIQFISWVFKVKREGLNELSEKEIEAMIEIGSKEGLIEEEEEIFLKHVLKMSKTEAEQAMTRLKDIDAINLNVNREILEQLLEEKSHTEFPVYEDDLNNIKGTISYQEVLKILQKNQKKKPLTHAKLTQALVVPKTISFIELFKLFVDKSKRMAIVIDEYGQTTGLITMDHIMEEITGATLKKTHQNNEPVIEEVSKNKWLADGMITIAKVNEALHIDLKKAEHKAMSLVILEKLKRFPEMDEVIEFEQIEVKITRIEKNVVKKIEIRKRENRKSIS